MIMIMMIIVIKIIIIIIIFCNMQAHTDKMIKPNKPDIIIKDKQEKTCMLIDMAIPSHWNTSV